jgi:ATP-dependent DNA helicase RecQ
MDADTINEIYDYFREAETDNLEKAMDELPDYSETEIRLVRIKFFSEMAN